MLLSVALIPHDKPAPISMGESVPGTPTDTETAVTIVHCFLIRACFFFPPGIQDGSSLHSSHYKFESL